MEARNTDFGVEVGVALVGKLAVALLGFIGTIVFARKLGPETFGGFYLLLAAATIAMRPVSGLATAVKQRFSEKTLSRSESTGALWVVIAATTLIALLFGVMLDPLVSSWSGIEAAGLLFVVLFGSLAFSESASTVLSATGRLSLESGTDLLGSILTLSCQLVLVLSGYGALGMAAGVAVGNLLTGAVAAALVGIRPAVPSKATLLDLWEFARYSIPARLCNKAYARLDLLLAGSLVSTTAAGYYEVAFKLTMPALYLATVVGTGMFARVGNNLAVDDKAAIQEDIDTTRRYGGLLALPLAAGALALGEPLITTLYGQEYAAAAVVVAWIGVYQFLRSQTVIMITVLEGSNAPHQSLRASLIATAANAVVGVPAAILAGLPGVVAATILAELLRFLVARAYVRGHGFTVNWPNLGPQIVAAATVGVIIYPARVTMNPTSIVEIVALVGVGAAIFATVLLATSQHARETARGILEDARAARTSEA